MCFMHDVVVILLAINMAPVLSTLTVIRYLPKILMLPKTGQQKSLPQQTHMRLHTLPLSW